MGSGMNIGIVVAIVVGCCVARGAGVVFALKAAKESDDDGDKQG
jgi:hypothetical protein